MVTFGGKFLKLLENHDSFFRYSVARKGERECLKRKKIWQSASKPPIFGERFRDYNRNHRSKGEWYSPFFLETESTKEAAGPRAIRGGATYIAPFLDPRYNQIILYSVGLKNGKIPTKNRSN